MAIIPKHRKQCSRKNSSLGEHVTGRVHGSQRASHETAVSGTDLHEVSIQSCLRTPDCGYYTTYLLFLLKFFLSPTIVSWTCSQARNFKMYWALISAYAQNLETQIITPKHPSYKPTCRNKRMVFTMCTASCGVPLQLSTNGEFRNRDNIFM